MAKRFDAAQLFEPWKERRGLSELAVYPTLEASLDAVQARTKGMSAFSDSVGTIAPGTHLRECLDLAAQRDLLVVLHCSPVEKLEVDRWPIDIYIARGDELWRVPAYQALWKTAFVHGRWSDAAENQASYLLGYTEEQRKLWLEASRQHRPAWTCATVYALLTSAQRKVVDSVGRRCFGPIQAITGMSLLYDGVGELKRNAFAMVPSRYTLARAGVRWAEFRTIFGKMNEAKVYEKKVNRKVATLLNSALKSNIQFLTRKGWE